MTGTAERRVETVAFPTLAELEKLILEPLSTTESELDALSMRFRSIAGQIDPARWEARLTSPPTFAELGTLAVFLDDLDGRLAAMQRDAAELRELCPALNALRVEGEVSWHDPGEGDDAG